MFKIITTLLAVITCIPFLKLCKRMSFNKEHETEIVVRIKDVDSTYRREDCVQLKVVGFTTYVLGERRRRRESVIINAGGQQMCDAKIA